MNSDVPRIECAEWFFPTIATRPRSPILTCSKNENRQLEFIRSPNKNFTPKTRKNLKFYLTDVPIDEHVPAIKIPVDDTGLVGMQIIQPFQDLLRPLLQRFHGYLPVFLPVCPQIARGTNLSDEIQGSMLIVVPDVIKRDDVLIG
ncbi:hypothetical protein SLA2020_305270 [Shorea laevis]